MEPTQVNPERRDLDAPPAVASTLGQLVTAGRAAGSPIPVATVVSIFDDLLAGEADPPGQRSPDLHDVLIDQAGVARLDVAADLVSIGLLLVETLDDDVPSAARWLVDRLLSASDDDQPEDADQLRAWVREALGQPASRTEVIALVSSMSAPLPVPDAVSDAPSDGEATRSAASVIEALDREHGPAAVQQAPAAEAPSVDDAPEPAVAEAEAPPVDDVPEPSEAPSVDDVPEPSAAEAEAADERAAADEQEAEGESSLDDAPGEEARATSEPAPADGAEAPDETALAPGRADKEPDANGVAVAAIDAAPDAEATAREPAADSASASPEAEPASSPATPPPSIAEVDWVVEASRDFPPVPAPSSTSIKDQEALDDSTAEMRAVRLPSAVEDASPEEVPEVTPGTDVTEALPALTPEEVAAARAEARLNGLAADQPTAASEPATVAGSADTRLRVESVEPVKHADPADTLIHPADFAPGPPSAEDEADEGEEDEDLYDLETIPPSAGLMAPLLDATEADIPTNLVRRKDDTEERPKLAPFPTELIQPGAMPAAEGRSDGSRIAPAMTDASPTMPAVRRSDLLPAIVRAQSEGGGQDALKTLPVIKRDLESPEPAQKGPQSNPRNRPVVRHQVKRDRRVAVPVAPASRRVVRNSGNNSIMGPSDRSFPWGWLVLIGVVAAASYYLLFT